MAAENSAVFITKLHESMLVHVEGAHMLMVYCKLFHSLWMYHASASVHVSVFP
jgi:hypothetical protein